jgi:hypothetical protein
MYVAESGLPRMKVRLPADISPISSLLSGRFTTSKSQRDRALGRIKPGNR